MCYVLGDILPEILNLNFERLHNFVTVSMNHSGLKVPCQVEYLLRHVVQFEKKNAISYCTG